jgi:hypothetical protein
MRGSGDGYRNRMTPIRDNFDPFIDSGDSKIQADGFDVSHTAVATSRLKGLRQISR